MLSPASTIRSGLFAQAVDGLGLSATQLQALSIERDNAATLAQAIREAVQRARTQGLDAFAPDSTTLQTAVSTSALRELFATVIGAPYSQADEASNLPDYGPLNLAQWSKAEEALAAQVARQDSMRPPGEGGGPQYARGHWYINGEAYTTEEALLTVRMGKLGNLDELLATHLNGLAVNTELARKLMRVMDDMKRRQDLREAQAAANGSAPATFPASTDFGTFVTAAGLTVQELMDLGLRFKGEASALRSLGANALAGTSATAGEYDEAITELQSIFDSLNTENDVKRLRVDSLHNERMSTLVGMSSLLEGTLTQARTVGRNL